MPEPRSPIPRLQAALQGTSFDGWLLYDFWGINPVAGQLLQIPEGIFLTRRFFVYVPRQGQAVVLHNHIEGGNWHKLSAHWGAELRPYGSHAELDTALHRLVQGQRVAMEYSPGGEVPYVSRVDAGTLERVKAAGVAQIGSSADLLQSFLVWSPEDLAAHQRAAALLVSAKDEAYRLMHERLRASQAVTEYEVQSLIMQRIEAAGLQSAHPVNVSFGVNAADAHYEPSAQRYATLRPGQGVLIDLWAQEAGRPYADITWVGFAGQPNAEYQSAWRAVRRAREAAWQLIQTRHQREGWGQLQGWEADRVAREQMGSEWAGYFLHRTGHDLGREKIHGAGANLDDYETHDTRALTPGLAVTIEPGTYPAHLGFGIRSEVNVYLAPQGPLLTTPAQHQPFILGEGEWEEVRQRALLEP